ncbi:MAG TPA: tRNA preQ1(34) S-adenosylmethionine ribosyltransferase-isomerase QueA [Pirellulaceae bacterium]
MRYLSEYAYELPPELVAQQPLPHRTDARLMVLDRQDDSIGHYYVRDLPELLRDGDLLVLNNSQVIPARLVGYRSRTRGRWEGLFLREDAQGVWCVLAKTRGKIASGEDVMLVNREGRDHTPLRLVESMGEGQWLVRPKATMTARELLGEIGRVPLPHYIRDGEMLPADVAAYQTVYATHPGSVAAPTAGLHFTHELLGLLEHQGIRTTQVTLHVGVGTFRPITCERIDDHCMHSEWGSISESAARHLARTRESQGRIVAVGTTTTRILESARAEVGFQAWNGATDLFIRPPYEFQAVDGLLTNFHLPRSTLLVLVRTFGGDALIQRAYAEAIQEQYRFYSYGDAMLIL